jgi:signal transduction histidine kinase
MRERATLLRGTLEIHSAPLKGTEVVAKLPLEDNHVG